MPLEKVREIVVIGNGFDLHCGLASRYEDFFKPRWNGKVASDELTLWDLILRGKLYEKTDDRDKNWYNLEGAMKDWLMEDHTRLEEEIDYAVSGGRAGRTGGPVDDNTRDIIAFLNETPDRRNQWLHRRDIYSMMFDELLRLEEAFALYIWKQVAGNSNYRQKANKMLHLLATKQCEDTDLDVSVLNFNFTHPVLKDSETMHVTNLNVHGRIQNELLLPLGDIIFGIDGQSLEPGTDCYKKVVPFTKTYRLLADSAYRGGLQLDGSGQVDMIKFYGHSLGEADHSYFQSIFDDVNLYGGDTRLIFYYSNFNENSRTEMFDKVVELMDRYSASFDNHAHGRNLMHKLLLENRLSIREYRPN